MNLKVTNVSSKNIMLVNGTMLKARQTVYLNNVKKGSELYSQLKNLEKLRMITIR